MIENNDNDETEEIGKLIKQLNYNIQAKHTTPDAIRSVTEGKERKKKRRKVNSTRPSRGSTPEARRTFSNKRFRKPSFQLDCCSRTSEKLPHYYGLLDRHLIGFFGRPSTKSHLVSMHLINRQGELKEKSVLKTVRGYSAPRTFCAKGQGSLAFEKPLRLPSFHYKEAAIKNLIKRKFFQQPRVSLKNPNKAKMMSKEELFSVLESVRTKASPVRIGRLPALTPIPKP